MADITKYGCAAGKHSSVLPDLPEAYQELSAQGDAAFRDFLCTRNAMQHTGQPGQPAILLKLPPEIRKMIYQKVSLWPWGLFAVSDRN